MASKFIRNLTIHSNNLGREVTLLLTFDSQDMTGIYVDYYPTAWRVSTFGPSGPYAMAATYENQLSFVKPQVVDNVIVNASTWIDINLGQQTTLTEEPSGPFVFSPPVTSSSVASQDIRAVNGTDVAQSLSIAFDTGKTYPPPSLLYFPGIGAGYNVTAEFTPTLRAYIVEDYQENEILRGAIQSAVIWKQDLAAISETTSWTLAYNPNTGTYSITGDQVARRSLNRFGNVST